MAEDSSLLQEVDDALRADKLEKLWARYSGAIISFCVLTVLASAASVLWKNHVRQEREQQTSLLVKASTLEAAGKYGEAISIYETAETEGGSLATLAALRRAEALASLQQNDKALAVYTDIAEGKTSDGSASLRDYAKLQADILSHNAAISAGKPLGVKENSKTDNTFRYTLSELSALRTLSAGDTTSARTELNRIVNDDNTPFSERERAGEILGSIGEDKK